MIAPAGAARLEEARREAARMELDPLPAWW
jgi:hypothetical protein